MKKILAVLCATLCVALPVEAMANSKLPFVGTRYFNWLGGNGTVDGVTITKNGRMTFKEYTKTSYGITYQGKYKPLVCIQGSEPCYKFLPNQRIALTNKKGKILNKCSESGIYDEDDGNKPCIQKLTKQG